MSELERVEREVRREMAERVDLKRQLIEELGKVDEALQRARSATKTLPVPPAGEDEAMPPRRHWWNKQ